VLDRIAKGVPFSHNPRPHTRVREQSHTLGARA
jgi:hypothetical protein